jgi:hypothetical protein
VTNNRRRELTEALFGVAPTLAFRVDLSLWTVLKQTLRLGVEHSAVKSTHHEWVVEVTNFVEKVDLIFARKQRRAYAVYRRVAPPLLKERTNVILGPLILVPLSHLIIKSTLLVQKLYKLRVCFAPPEIEVPDLEITPD